MCSRYSQEMESAGGCESFEIIFGMPSCDSFHVITSRLKELSSFKGDEQTRTLKVDSTSKSENSMRRCRSDSTDRTGAAYSMPVTSKDDSVEFMWTRPIVGRRRSSNRAQYNFQVGLLTHCEAIKARRNPPGNTNTADAIGSLMTFSSASSFSQDAIWDMLLQ